MFASVSLLSSVQNHAGVHDPRDDPSAPPRPFLFNFFIDSVPFEACTQTESDLAGGNISIDTEAQAVAQAQAPASSASASSSRRSSRGGSVAASSPPPLVQSGRRYSVHKPLTAAEYEAALHEANERERLEEEAAKEARRAAKEKEESHHHHHRKLSSESQSRA